MAHVSARRTIRDSSLTGGAIAGISRRFDLRRCSDVSVATCGWSSVFGLAALGRRWRLADSTGLATGADGEALAVTIPVVSSRARRASRRDQSLYLS